MPTTMDSDLRPETAQSWDQTVGVTDWIRVEGSDGSPIERAEAIMPNNDRLRRIAENSSPPAEWWDEESPF